MATTSDRHQPTVVALGQLLDPTTGNLQTSGLRNCVSVIHESLFDGCNQNLRNTTWAAIALSLTCCASQIPEWPPGIFLDHPRPGDIAGAPPLRPVTADGLALTKKYEQFRSHLYNDVANFCTIGYGHLVERFSCNGSEQPDFLRGITEERGEVILTGDMTIAQHAVQITLPRSWQALTDREYSAICDFVFNVGSEKFRTSHLQDALENDDLARVAPELRRWVYAGGKRRTNLVERREAEITLFFEGIQQPRPRPGDLDNTPVDILVGEVH
jgi:lysozyme